MSRTDDNSPEITPQVLHLSDVLKWVGEGKLRLPYFQRDFVWSRQDMIDLLDSIAHHYPIGSIFLWSKKHLPPSRDTMGPLRLPDPEDKPWLVLDGQQRLTTLAGILLRDMDGWDAGRDEEDRGRWDVYYDAEGEQFTHWSPSPLEQKPPASYIRIHEMLDVITFWDWAEGARAFVERAKMSRLQEVSRAFQSYRIPIVQFASDDLSIAVESFSRLNRKGRSISQDEMFSALTYDGDFHLASHIDTLQEDMVRDGFGRMDRTLLLRAVLAAAELDIYRTDWSRLGDKTKDKARNDLPDAIEAARRGLEKTRGFLRDIGVLNWRMLPYSMQLVTLSAFFCRCDTPTDAQRALLVRWFWASSFTGWFGGQNPSRVHELVVEFRDRLPGDPKPTALEKMDLGQPALPTPDRFDLRSARVRALLCRLLALEPRRPDGRPVRLDEAAQMLLERGSESTTRVFATVADKALRTSPANRIFDVEPSIRGQARNWLKALAELSESDRAPILASHALPVDAFELLVSGDSDAFLVRRMALLNQLERDFMRSVGVTPGPEGVAQSALDADDDPPLGGDDDLPD